MDKFKLFKFGDTRIQFNEIGTNEVKIVNFVCEHLRDEVFNHLTAQNKNSD